MSSATKAPVMNINVKTIGLKTYRGVVCLETMPEFLVWGLKDTVLECRHCLTDGLYHNVLVGLCYNCRQTYESILNMPDLFKYGFYFPDSGQQLPMKSHGSAFQRPVGVFVPHVQFKPGFIHSHEAYTMYNLVHLSSVDDINLLMEPKRSPFAGIARYYNLTSPEKKTALINAIASSRIKLQKPMPVDLIYTACDQLEKEFRNSDKPVECNYCEKEVPMNQVYNNSIYCSFACHTRARARTTTEDADDFDDLPDLITTDDEDA